MKVLKTSQKIIGSIQKIVNPFFGSDERGFMTLLVAALVCYGSGFPDAATILAVYSSMFGYSGMQAYNENTGSSGSASDELEDMENMMEEALGMAQEFQEKEGEEK